MVKIIADSTCDLSEELIKKYDISILPLHILLGEEEYEDGKTITPEEIFAWSDAHKTTPKTSAPGLEQALALIRPFVEEEREVICFSISDSMSTSGNVMRLAVEELHADGLVTVIDSENLSTGIGLLVVEAAQMAQEGKAAVEITERVYDLRPRVRASFVVDTLTYLHRGGRCSGVAALAGSVLKLASVVRAYVTDMEDELRLARPERVFITHSGCERAIVEETRSYLEELGVFEEILETRAGGVVSSHCGPGTLGVLFIAR